MQINNIILIYANICAYLNLKEEMKKTEDKLSKAAKDFAQMHFHRDERPISINSFINGAHWQYEQQKKTIKLCQRVANIDKGCAPSAEFIQKLIETVKEAMN